MKLIKRKGAFSILKQISFSSVVSRELNYKLYVIYCPFLNPRVVERQP